MEFQTRLFSYQQKAFEKLSKIKIGALYMEQGTGKTRTTLELLNARIAKKKIDVILWLCPCSVKRNLKDDLLFHCGMIPNEIIVRGIESLSSSSRLYLQLNELVHTYNVYLIVDESNLVKNKDAIRTERIMELAKHCQYKLILNGTPVSKNEADMFAQWYILDWRILGYKSFYSFAANHLEYRVIKDQYGNKVVTNQVRRVLNIDYLTEKIAPYTYQIKKSECLDLAPKNYFRECFYLTKEQYEIYGMVKSIYLEQVNEIRSETIYKLFSALQHVVSGRHIISSPVQPMQTEQLFNPVTDNPRLQKLHKIICENIQNEKCIIFAKYQSELDNISVMLDCLGLSWVLFTGKVSQKKRQENRVAFMKEVQFLLANKVCGAYGLNLQFCHNIIYYSNDFDLATRMQSEDRIYRIGQEHEVNIYDIYCPGTIDEFIIDCINRKGNLVARFKAEIDRWRNEKMITYKKFSASKNPDFYLIFGRFFASRQIRKELDGYPLSNEDDWIWITAMDKNTVAGFMALEATSKAMRIHATYVFGDYRHKGILKEMLDRACNESNKEPITATIRDYLEKVYIDAGFIITGKKGKNWLNVRREASA